MVKPDRLTILQDYMETIAYVETTLKEMTSNKTKHPYVAFVDQIGKLDVLAKLGLKLTNIGKLVAAMEGRNSQDVESLEIKLRDAHNAARETLKGDLSLEETTFRTTAVPSIVMEIVQVVGSRLAFGSSENQMEKEYLSRGKYSMQRANLPVGLAEQTKTPAKDSRRVFVVHGRNLEAYDAVCQFLRSIDLHPMEWPQILSSTGKGSPYIGEILEKAFSEAQAVVVLMTPDDEGCLRKPFRKPEDPTYETELTPQARLNVLFEAGMAMTLFQGRAILVELGKLRPFSDISGRHILKLDNTVTKRQELAQRLKTAGCAVDISGTTWHTAGEFVVEQAKKPTKNELSSGKPECDLASFDRSFKALQEVSEPRAKATMLDHFQPKLRSLCYDYYWKEVESRIKEVLKYMPKSLSNNPHALNYLQYLAMIVNRYGEHTIDAIREKWLEELEHLYKDSKYETNSTLLDILQELHQYSKEYLMKLINDSSTKWSDSRFQDLANQIGWSEFRKRNGTAYNGILEYLGQKMNDADRNKEEKIFERLKFLYQIATR